ncbi:hypothetical protein RhiirA4_458494 [Rhizophagus irregularis]|uniref:Uncharacterized protein n=1 Tax=Rhizophagus irregularis TaxID=588596 RepID=A0A2I1GCA0_9GLOM|nr:hypothetical protein RhiirA4_458494 [Rhizophagus irregularis]
MKKYLIKLTRIAITRQQNIAISKSKVKITADKQGIDLVGASCEFYGSEINSEYSNQNLNNNEHIIGKNERKRPAEEASSIDEPQTPEDKVVVFSIVLMYSSQKYLLTFQMRSQIRITSGTEIEETDSNMTYSDEEPSETFLSQQSYTNTTKVNSSLALAKEVEKEKK